MRPLECTSTFAAVFLFLTGFGSSSKLGRQEVIIDESERFNKESEGLDSTGRGSLAGSGAQSAVHAPRECPRNISNLWLDIVFVLDSSRAIGDQDFSGLLAFLIGFAQQIPVGQGEGMFTRVALVSVSKKVTRWSNLTTYHNRNELVNHLMQLKADDDFTFDMGAGLVEAEGILAANDERKDVRNLVVLFSTRSINCDDCDERSEGVDPCTVAARLVEDPSTVLMTVGMRFQQESTYPNITFGTPCYAIVNDQNLMENLISLATRANCFCPCAYIQFTDSNDICHVFGECVVPFDIPTAYFSAQIGCQMEHATLADVLSEEKDQFLKRMAVKDEVLPYWLGLRMINGEYRWDSGPDNSYGDYTDWAADQPDLSKGDCVKVDKSHGFVLEWYSERCNWTSPSYYYFCQKKTCDTERYCS